MKKLFFLAINLLFFYLLTINIYAEEPEPGGWVEPGGYDPVAEAKKQKALDDKIIAEKNRIQAAKKQRQLENKKKAELTALLPENMAKVDNDRACMKAGNEIRNSTKTNWQDEIKKRGLNIDLYNAKKKNIFIGSTTCDIYANLGLPNKINRTVSKNYVRKQFVYDGLYIYTDNEFVTSWQD